MSAYKDEKRGTWKVFFYYTDWSGQRKGKTKRGFATKREALEWERAFLAESQGDLNMRFEAFVAVYLKDKKNQLKPKTLKNKKYMLEKHILPYFGLKSVNKITAPDILTWQNEITEMGYGAAYLRMINNAFFAILNHAERYYGLKNNPAKKMHKMGKNTKRRLEFWTKEQFEVFIASFGQDERMYKTVYMTLYYTGCRIGEVLALTPLDINVQEQTINIDKTFFRLKGEDVVTSPKTERSNRIVAIPRVLAYELDDYMHCVYGLSDANRIFQCTDRVIQKKIISHAEVCGLPQIRVHDLRHSHVAYLIDKGVAPLNIAERLGHESITTTMDIYGHLYPNRNKEVAELFDT